MKAKKRKSELLGGFYVVPAMALLIMLLIIPLMYTVYCGFFQYKYMMKGNFVGLDNYIYCLTDPTTRNAFLTTLLVTIASTAISIVVGLILALWIDKRGGFFAYIIELIGLVPWVISMVVAGLLWRWLFNGDLGLFNVILKFFGLDPIYVIQNKVSAVIALIFVMSWRTIGYAMILILAGLKGLDGSLLEAAKVDGATAVQSLFKIKLPLIKSQVLLATIVLTVSNFTNNTVPKVLTSGGPVNATNVITLEQYNLSFIYYEFGRSSALSVLIMLVVTIIIACYIKVARYEI